MAKIPDKAQKTAKATKAGKKQPGRRGKVTAGHNYLIIGVDGSLTVVSSSTGEVHRLTKDEAAKVLPLLRKRQQLGYEMAAVLQELGLKISKDERIVDEGP